MAFMTFHVLGIVTPSDYSNIFQRGRYTTNQSIYRGFPVVPFDCRMVLVFFKGLPQGLTSSVCKWQPHVSPAGFDADAAAEWIFLYLLCF